MKIHYCLNLVKRAEKHWYDWISRIFPYKKDNKE